MNFTAEKLTTDTYNNSNGVWDMSACQFTEQFREQVKCGNREAYLFKLNDEYIAGCDLVFDYDDYTEKDKKIYLSRLIVKKEYRNQGIGQSVLQYMVELCKEKGYQHITVGVDSDNDNAIHIYKKHGFKIYENPKDEYGDYYKMIIDLSNDVNMKIGIITDIHNNIYALNAVLDEFDKIGVEKIICCGDIIGIGSKPDETVKRIIELKDILECVRGNHDNYFISGMPSDVPNNEMMSYTEMDHHKWEHSKLSDESKEFIKSLPFTKMLSVGNKTIYIVHYSMYSENKYSYNNYKAVPTIDDLRIMFDNIDADIIIYGHNHNTSVINDKNKWYINCGSLGCPMGESIARAGVLNIDDNITYEQLSVPYDVSKAVDDIKNAKYPDYENILKFFYGI